MSYGVILLSIYLKLHIIRVSLSGYRYKNIIYITYIQNLSEFFQPELGLPPSSSIDPLTETLILSIRGPLQFVDQRSPRDIAEHYGILFLSCCLPEVKGKSLLQNTVCSIDRTWGIQARSHLKSLLPED